MKILVLQNNPTQHPSQVKEFLDLGYPDAERIFLSDPQELDATLDREQINLVVIDSLASWGQGSQIINAIHSRHPGLPVVLLAPERSATQQALERELHHSQVSFDWLLNTPSDLILLIDTQHRVITANQAFYQLSGKRPEEVVGRTQSEILPPDLAERRDAALRQVFETGEAMRFEDRGVNTWLDIAIYPVRDLQGQIIHAIVYAHDITERKILEDGLRQSHQTIDALLNAPTDIVLLLDRENKILIANQTFTQRFNKKPDEVRGLSLYEFLPLPLAQERSAIAQQVFETGQTVRYEDKGVSGWFDNSVYPILDDQGKVASVAVVARDITDRKKLEENLRRDQRAMLAMANAPNDIFLLLDRAGTILKTNQMLAQSMKRKLDELSGLSYWDILPKPAADFRRPIFDRVIQTGISERVEDRGPFGVYDSRVIPITNDQDEVVQVVIQARDITNLKQMELALRESEKRYRSLVETSPDGISLQDLEGRLVFVNQQFATIFGYENPEEMYELQIKGSDLIIEEELIRWGNIVTEAFQIGSVWNVNFTAHRKDRSLFHLEGNGSVVFDQDGKPTGIISVCRDVTERIRTENALKESEERYRTLIETSPDGILYHDLEGRLLLINQQFASLFGYQDVQELYAKNLTNADLIAEEDLPRLREIMKSAVQHGYVRDVTITARRKDGSMFHLEANGSNIFDQQGNPLGFIAICRDVTERDRIQEELVKAHQHLEHRVIERTAELQAINRQLRKEIFLRKQAEEQWRRHAQHSEALARVASRANAQLGLKAVLLAICEEVIHALDYPISSIGIYNEQDDTIKFDAYASRIAISIDQVPPIPRSRYEGHLQQPAFPIIVPDVRSVPEINELASKAVSDMCTAITYPLFNDGELIGALIVASVGIIHLPNDDELNLLQAISDQAALSIMNARLFDRVSDSQTRLRTLTERLVEVQEAEIRYVARELHDEIGQMLTSLSLNLEIITRMIEADQEKSAIQLEMERIRVQVKQLLNQVRELSLNLLPAMLDDLGLLPALLDHCQRFTAQTGIQVNLAHQGVETRFPARLETATYRIVQEALTNVARHAEVKQVDVRLWSSPFMLGVQVEDQGVGFDLQQVENAHRSSGLAGMRERAANCGGTLEIETTPGQGTCLTVEFPFNDFDQFLGAP